MGWIRRETEKGTTQYICPNCHDYHEFREDFGEQMFSENFIFCRRCGARNGTGTAPTLTPSNEPLTLEELRKMSYIDWVWVIYPELPPEENEWFRASELYKRYSHEHYGKTWIAYRRQPEVSP